MIKPVNKIHQVIYWVIPFGIFYAFYKINRLRDGLLVTFGLGAINAIPVIVQMILDPDMIHEGTSLITGGMIILIMPLTSLIQVLVLLRWSNQWNEKCQ
jgi:hypothetical protein